MSTISELYRTLSFGSSCGHQVVAKFILYADDANIIVSGFTIEKVYQKIQDLTSCLVKWVNCNGLALNLIKTKYMIFTRKRTYAEQSIRINNVLIERKSTEKFLGVIFNN